MLTGSLRHGLYLTAVALLLAGCGGGGATGSTATPMTSTMAGPAMSTAGAPAQSPALSGTVATGAALVGANVTVKGVSGTPVSTTTDGSGDYSVDLSGMTGPFMVQATDGNVQMMSLVFQSGTANVNPVTNMIVSQAMQAMGENAAQAFQTLSTGTLLPSQDNMTQISQMVTGLMSSEMQSMGVATSFDPTTSSFTANHQGFDEMLDQMTVNGDTMTIQDGNGTQSITFMVDRTNPSSPMVSATSNSTATGVTSASVTMMRGGASSMMR